MLPSNTTLKPAGPAWCAYVTSHTGVEGQNLLWLQAPNGADPLRYAFLVSQARLVSEASEAAAADFSACAPIDGAGDVTVGVRRADGHKCQR